MGLKPEQGKPIGKITFRSGVAALVFYAILTGNGIQAEIAQVAGGATFVVTFLWQTIFKSAVVLDAYSKAKEQDKEQHD